MAVPAEEPEERGYDKANPFSAAVLERTNLNGRGSGKKTLHLELSLTGSGITYQPGDAMGVLPRISDGLPDDLLVPKMHAIKHADGKADFPSASGKLSCGVNEFHCL